MRRRLSFVLCVLLPVASATSAETGGIRMLPVPAATILAGQVITQDDLTGRQFMTTPRSLAGIATAADEITGKEARRPLRAGRPIPLSAVVKPTAVKSGARVMASYAEDGFSISTEVIALDDGSAGDVISVRNPATGAVIRAEVLANGMLAVSDQ